MQGLRKYFIVLDFTMNISYPIFYFNPGQFVSCPSSIKLMADRTHNHYSFLGSRFEDYTFQSIQVPSSAECAQHCLVDQRCQSINYQSSFSMYRSAVCEMNNSTKNENSNRLKKDPSYTYYELQRKVGVISSERSK